MAFQMHNFMGKKIIVQFPGKNYLKMKKILSEVFIWSEDLCVFLEFATSWKESQTARSGDLLGPRFLPGGPDAPFTLFLWVSVSSLQ